MITVVIVSALRYAAALAAPHYQLPQWHCAPRHCRRTFKRKMQSSISCNYEFLFACKMSKGGHFSALSLASTAAEHGGALAAPPAAAAPPRTASSSLSAARGPHLTFTYHDRFLGKAVRIPLAQHLQSAAPLMLVAPALHFARGLAAAGATPQQLAAAPHVSCMLVELWLAQRTRFMFGLTVKACDRASTAPASSHVYIRTASRWSSGILRRVMAGYVSKVQVRWLLRVGARRLFL